MSCLSKFSNSFLKNYPIVTINNAVDLTVFSPKGINNYLISKYKLSNKFVMMAAATSWSKNKGFEDYLELSKLLSDDEIIVLIGLKDEIIKTLPSNILGIGKNLRSCRI